MGDLDVYQLVKYEINRVCKKEYEGKEIIVDHLLLRNDQLKYLKVGQKVFLSVTQSKTETISCNRTVTEFIPLVLSALFSILKASSD
jgi:hypothetical protein